MDKSGLLSIKYSLRKQGLVLINSKKEVMFKGVLICLSVCFFVLFYNYLTINEYSKKSKIRHISEIRHR